MHDTGHSTLQYICLSSKGQTFFLVKLFQLPKLSITVNYLLNSPTNVKVPTKQFVYRHAAVASDNAECSKVGRNILKKGGSAVDAAVATTLCVGVINMHSTGIGGGGFMMVYDSHKRSAEVIDFRETAPEKSGVDSLSGDPMNGIRGTILRVLKLPSF